MKIALAQCASTKGDVAANIAMHTKYIQHSVTSGADLIVFPELSLTGYEPGLAAALATDIYDPNFEVFQALSDRHHVVIGAGMPIKNKNGIHIGLVWFQPNKPVTLNAKKYLHADEEPFFASGENFPVQDIANEKIGLAICYEITIAAHANAASEGKATIYLASVAKTAKGVLNAHSRLSEIAKENSMLTLMVNSVGPNDDFISAGQSAAWSREGILLGTLNETTEGILYFDSSTSEVENVIID